MPKPKPERLTFIETPEKSSAAETVVLLTKAQARKIVDRVNAHFTDARALLLELEEREGWRALGYDSWRSCAIAEFGKSASRVYQLVDAAKVERAISTMVDSKKPIPERLLRPLATLETEEEQRKRIKKQPKAQEASVSQASTWKQ